jgi:hypothetical protein
MSNNLWIQPEELGDYAYTEYTDEAVKVASYLLWAMSGRKYAGETTVTERYTCTLRNTRLGPSVKTNSPILFGGDVYNIPSGDFDEYAELSADGMSPGSRIKLRGRPVTKIHTIRNRTGTVIDPSKYYLVDHSTIHITAGTPWTPCNTEVTYSYGTPVPIAGKMAARKLAIEFARLWNGDEQCELPQRVTSVSRQGVSYTILDNQEFIDELRTGLYEIDLFLKVANPDNARRKAKVFSVDTPRARRYSPKTSVLPKVAEYDLTLVRDTPAEWSSTGLSVDLSNFFSGDDWTPVVTLRSHSGSKSVDLEAESVVLDQSLGALSFSVQYEKAIAALGMIDPGSWALYATKTVDDVPNIVELASGNLQIRLYTN